jgi:hypothetical protein
MNYLIEKKLLTRKLLTQGFLGRFLTISDKIPTSAHIGSYMHNYLVSIAWFTSIINDCKDCEGTKIDEIDLDFLCDILAIFHRWHIYSLSSRSCGTFQDL